MELVKSVNELSFDDIKGKGLQIKTHREHPELFMITYPKNHDDFSEPWVQQARGAIFEKGETAPHRLVCMTFSRSLKMEDPEQIKELPDFAWDKVRIEESVDGTQIKVFHHEGRWHVATTRCIDARNALWYSEKSFYELFMEALPEDFSFDNLREDYCYAFVLKHPENRIVVKYEKPEVIHVLTRSMVDEGYPEVPDYEIEGISKPNVIEDFTDYDDLLRDLSEKLPSDIDSEGFVIINENNERVKLKYSSYCALRDIRGNTYSIFYRYLELRTDSTLLEEFLRYYPDHRDCFEYYEKDIRRFFRTVHNTYMNRWANPIEGFVIPDYLKTTIYKIHGGYLEERTNRTFEKVSEHMNSLHPKQLCSLLNAHWDHQTA